MDGGVLAGSSGIENCGGVAGGSGGGVVVGSGSGSSGGVGGRGIGNSGGVVADGSRIVNSGSVAGGSGGGVVFGSGTGSSGGVASAYGGGVVGRSGFGVVAGGSVIENSGGVAGVSGGGFVGGVGIGKSGGGVSGGAGGVAAGSERRRLEIEPKPFGEMTMFNWKKLMQMANNEPVSDDSDDDVDKYMRVERPKPNNEPVSDDDSDDNVDQYMCVERPRPNNEIHDSDDDVDKYTRVERQKPNKRPRNRSGSQEVQKWRRTSVRITDASGLAERKIGRSTLQLKHLVETTSGTWKAHMAAEALYGLLMLLPRQSAAFKILRTRLKTVPSTLLVGSNLTDQHLKIPTHKNITSPVELMYPRMVEWMKIHTICIVG